MADFGKIRIRFQIATDVQLEDAIADGVFEESFSTTDSDAPEKLTAPEDPSSRLTRFYATWHYFFVKNIDTTNTLRVTWSSSGNGAGVNVCDLAPGKMMLISDIATLASIQLKGIGGTCRAQFMSAGDPT